MKDFVKVASKGEIAAGTLKLVQAEGEQILLTMLGSDIIAFDNVCPHLECDLAFGEVDADNEIECDCHGSRFNVKTGEVLQGPATTNLRLFAVRVEGNDVLVGPP